VIQDVCKGIFFGLVFGGGSFGEGTPDFRGKKLIEGVVTTLLELYFWNYTFETTLYV
jgi:hypothetical protein